MGALGIFTFFLDQVLRLDIEPLRPNDRVSFVFVFVHVFL